VQHSSAAKEILVKTGLPFDLACLIIGAVLSWLGTLAFPRHPALVASAIDVFIVWVLPYTPPFRLPGSQCGSLWSAGQATVNPRSACIPSWGAVGKAAAAVPPGHWIKAAVILGVPFILCHVFAGRATRLRSRNYPRDNQDQVTA
jgi:hypothetical protein